MMLLMTVVTRSKSVDFDPSKGGLDSFAERWLHWGCLEDLQCLIQGQLGTCKIALPTGIADTSCTGGCSEAGA